MTMKSIPCHAIVALCALLPAVHGARGADAPAGVTLHYYERPPLHYTNTQARADGFIVDKTERIFLHAGIAYAWQVTPANRILALIKNAPGYHCAPGWYHNPERAVYARFSDPIYRDKPLVGLGRPDFNVPDGISAVDLFQLPAIRLLLKQNFSQGAYMDALIKKMPEEKIQRVSAEVPVMVQMIKRGRADLIITTQEETETFVSSAGYRMQEFRILKFPDVPAVEMRYLLCGKNVPPEMMLRLNVAIAKSKATP